jgi:hypothetical protein
MQMVALVVADYFLSLGWLWQWVGAYEYSTNAVGTVCHVTIDLATFWSTFIEVQIALGVLGACRRWKGFTKVLHYMMFTSLVLAMGLVYLDQWSLRESKGLHGVIWCSIFTCSLLLTASAYFWAAIGAHSAWTVRRRIILRGLVYALIFAATILPNLVLDLLIQLQVDESPDDHQFGHHSKLFRQYVKVCRLLYCLNGMLNVGTYICWMRIDERVVARAQAAADIAIIEEAVLLQGHFMLSDTFSEISRVRDVADAISHAQSLRSPACGDKLLATMFNSTQAH